MSPWICNKLPKWRAKGPRPIESLDKTTLRIILAIAGIALLLGIYLWDRWKKRRELKQTLETLDSAVANDDELEEIDTISINPAEETLPPDVEAVETERIIIEDEEHLPEEEAPEPAAKPADLPEVIQISIAAPRNRPFRGPELLAVFRDLGLEYGEMAIFHCRQDGEIVFSLASMVKPGTFPIEEMKEFQTPGLTLFMQPPLVREPIRVFEKMVQTCHILSQRLGGHELDDRRQPLTSVKLSQWRRQLRGEG